MPCVNLVLVAKPEFEAGRFRVPGEGAAEVTGEGVAQVVQEVPVVGKKASIRKFSLPWAGFSLRSLPWSRRPAAPTRADLLNAESAIGGTMFGPIPEGHRREFFHDKENVWLWHEEWLDANMEMHELTVRYEVLTTGVYKKVAAGKYYRITGQELENFRKATKTYLRLIKEQLYHLG